MEIQTVRVRKVVVDSTIKNRKKEFQTIISLITEDSSGRIKKIKLILPEHTIGVFLLLTYCHVKNVRKLKNQPIKIVMNGKDRCIAIGNVIQDEFFLLFGDMEQYTKEELLKYVEK